MNLSHILIVLTCVSTWGTIIPPAFSQSNLENWREGWVELQCEGEPSLILLPEKEAELNILLKDNQQLQELVGGIAKTSLSPSLLNTLKEIARYGIGEFRRQSEGTSMALLGMFFDEDMIQIFFDNARVQLEQEARQACLQQEKPKEYIWEKPLS